MNTTTIRNMTAGEFEQHINALVVVDANGLATTIRAGYGCTRPEAEKIAARLKATHRHALTHRA